MTDLVVPPFCYLPLCRSVDTWRYVLRPLPMESHAFNTKARCPALMLFEVEEYTAPGEGRVLGLGSDVASFLSLELHEFSDDTIPLATGKNSTPVFFHEAKESSSPVVECQQSLFANRSNTPHTRLNCWRLEGTGILRILDETVRSSSLPVQTSENNPALREIQRDKTDKDPNKPPSVPGVHLTSPSKGEQWYWLILNNCPPSPIECIPQRTKVLTPDDSLSASY